MHLPGEQSREQRTIGWTALLHLLMLRRTRLQRQWGAVSVVSLGLGSLLAWTVIDWLNHQPEPQFYIYGLPSIGWYVLLTLSLAAVFAFRCSPQIDFVSALTLVLIATVIAIVVTYLIETFTVGALATVATVTAWIYLAFFVARGLRALTGRSQPVGMLLAVLLLGLFSWSTANLYVAPSVWTIPEQSAETEEDDTWQRAEALLFSQPARIDAAIAALARPEEAAPAAFFLGFAGMGEQRVFAEEIKLAARTIGARYGSEARNVLLINDRRDLEAQPLASPTALRYALRGIAAKMAADDVLFLSLSSHGSKDATISVSNGSLMLHDLSAADLTAALQDAGIKWRVIVISACYSGSFIDPLKNAQTVVITAAAADRTSFGCSDDRDLTYFGEAFYRDALPKAKSLRAAYEAARDDIKQREQQEGITASRPQAFFGREIERKLLAMERQ